MRAFVHVELTNGDDLFGWMDWEDRASDGFDMEIWSEGYAEYLTGWRSVYVTKWALFRLREVDMSLAVEWLSRRDEPPHGMEEAHAAACAWVAAWRAERKQQRAEDDSARQQRLEDDDVPF